MNVLRQVHAWVAWAVVGLIALQVFLAGLAIRELGGNGSFDSHRGLGYALGLVFLALVLTALGSGRRRIQQSAGLLGLYVVQSILPNLDPGLPLAAALHPVNAMLMFAFSVWYARSVWRERATVPA